MSDTSVNPVLQLTAVPPGLPLPASVSAAVRMMFDWLATGRVMPFNLATAVRGPRHSVKTGKTPVLAREEARQLLDSIDVTAPIGLRDRALIGKRLAEGV